MDIMNIPEHIMKRIQELPMVSDVAVRLMDIISTEKHSLQQVIDVIEHDVYLTTRLLRIANSAAFARGQSISTIQRAVVNLGEDLIMGIAVGACSGDVFQKELKGYDGSTGALWRHSLLTAFAAKKISELVVKNPPNSSLAYTAGLLHDIGMAALSEFLEQGSKKLNGVGNDEGGKSYVDVEQELTGTDHTELGYEIAKNWQLPEELLYPIRYHHEPSKAPAEHKEIVYCVHLGDILARCTGFGVGNENLSMHLDSEYVDYFNLNRDHLDMLIVDIQDEFERVRESILGPMENEVVDHKTILIVDDSKTARLVIKRCLEIAGWQDEYFLEAENGIEAIEFLGNHPVDIIFTDLNMPRMGGEQLIKLVKSKPEFQNIPIVAISSLNNAAKTEELKLLGVKTVLGKPVTPMDIVNSIKGM
ncbi:HDOD domain-containing protein [bacterium]|nr:HDOD domain-containing protein [bacterium]